MDEPVKLAVICSWISYYLLSQLTQTSQKVSFIRLHKMQLIKQHKTQVRRDISRMIGELWNKLKEAGKAVYQEKVVRDKERYRTEMEDYKERLKMVEVVTNALPIQQQLPEPEVTMMGVDEKIENEGRDSPQTPENELSSEKNDKSNFEDNGTEDKDIDMENESAQTERERIIS